MDFVVITILVVVAVSYLYNSGHEKLKKREISIRRIEWSIRQQHENVIFLGRVSYHGGFPPIPRPITIMLGMVEDGVVFYDENGRYEKTSCKDWVGLDKFCIQNKSHIGCKRETMRPLAGVFIKNELRYFIVIKYFDVDKQKNNILFEVNNRESQQFIYDKIYDKILSYHQGG